MDGNVVDVKQASGGLDVVMVKIHFYGADRFDF